MSTLNVLICDDHAGFRASLSALLTGGDEVLVVGEVADGAHAVRSALALQPDVVLMDLAMPGMGGVEATRCIVDSAPHIGVIVLTMIDDDDAVFAAMRAGARGYLLKGARRAEIVRALRAVADGDAVFGGAIAGRLTRYFDPPTAPSPSRSFPGLTPREVEVLTLMAQHLANPAIARTLGISEKTVRNNVSAVLVKLRVADRAQAILAAHDAGMGPGQPPSAG
ncbi:response regulator transcription factor [Pengzhenrongella sp.]|uniref:response regulator transcription factor n=1 Tax=Pengzhenrongella sp. TaxID=2888820 RepID=UPI002F929C10